MSGARTEQPTPRRLREARNRGDVGRSRELTGAVVLAAGLLAVLHWGPRAIGELASLLRAALLGLEPGALAAAALAGPGRAALPLLAVPALAATVAALLQSGGSISFQALRPRFERIDPLAGLRRLASPATLAAAILSLAKVAALGLVLCGWLGDHGRALARLPGLDAPLLWRAIPIGPLAAELAVVALAFGLVDLVLARRRHRRALMMTRDEVRREHREDEGDPQHRAERRRLHRDLLEAGPVSTATVVVVNPTHVAVALRHRRESDEAPRLLAKGTGEAAARIRSAARRAGVPIVRDVALARAIGRLVDVGEEIPAELYEAAAAVLLHVYGPPEPRG